MAILVLVNFSNGLNAADRPNIRTDRPSLKGSRSHEGMSS
jgi:hypothetical protein